MAGCTGVVLAGGQGTRMGALTETVPKPLLSVAGKPIVEHTLERGNGAVDRWCLVVGYRGEQIRDHFGDAYAGTPITYATQETPLGTAHALEQALDAVPDDTSALLVMNGDAVVPRRLQRDLAGRDGPAIPVRYEADPDNGIVVLEDSRVVDAVEEPDSPPSNYVLCGTYRLEPDIREYLDVEKSPTGEYWLTDAIRAYCGDREVAAVPFDGPLFAANTARELGDLAARIEAEEI